MAGMERGSGCRYPDLRFPALGLTAFLQGTKLAWVEETIVKAAVARAHRGALEGRVGRREQREGGVKL